MKDMTMLALDEDELVDTAHVERLLRNALRAVRVARIQDPQSQLASLELCRRAEREIEEMKQTLERRNPWLIADAESDGTSE